MARSTRKTRPGFIFIPEWNYSVSYKILITDESVTPEVETELTDYALSFKVDWPLGRLAIAQISISNSNGIWLNKWNGGEKVEIWAEYGDTATPTNKIFKGKLDNVYFSFGQDGYKANLECRQTPEMADIKIVKNFVNKTGSAAIKEIIDTYYSGYITYNNVSTTTERVTVSYEHVSAIQAIQDIARRTEMDVYIDTALDIHYFEKESVDNTDEAVSYQTNLFSLPKYGKDNSKIFNRVVVYGKDDSNIILLKTEQDIASQNSLWRKDLVITDTGLTTMEEIQEKANVELTNNTNVEEDGRISTLAMPKARPGDMMTVLVPFCGLAGKHKVESVSWSYGMNGFISDLQIKDRQATISELFRERIDAEEMLKPYGNLNDMTDSYTIDFTESPPVLTLSNTGISSSETGVLYLLHDKSSGEAIADTIVTDANVLSCELRIKGNYPDILEGITYFASNNGGVNWEEINPGSLHTFASSGNELALKMVFDSSVFENDIYVEFAWSPALEKVCLLYKIGEA